MPLIRSSSNWKAVKYDKNIDNNEEFQFLSTFEELDDYEILKKGFQTEKVSSKSPSKSKSDRKRKRRASSSSSAPEPENPDTEPEKKKRKRKQQHKKKKPTKESVEIDESKKNVKKSKKSGSKSISKSKIVDEEVSEESEPVDMTSWEELFVPEPILRALAKLRFKEPTEIQKLTMPSAIRDRLDILGAAETGSGKTLAFAIPIIAGLLSEKSSESNQAINEEIFGPKALILTPTRELALQIKEHISAILAFTDMKVACVVGGLSVQKQQRLLKKRPEILIATPGRLWALMEEGFEYVKDIYHTVRYLAIDETDRMVEKGHFVELSSILEFLRKDPETVQSRQTFVFSATLTYVHPAPKRLVSAKQSKQMTPQDKINMLVSMTGLRKQRKVLDITRQFGTAEGLTETRLNCANLLEKDASLYYFLTNYTGRTLIFTNSIDCARRLRSLLTHLRLNPLILHAQMHQKQRLKNLERFSDKEGTVLLATDVASRGLDIKNIEHVIHYQVPRTAEIYVHRSGRTARASHHGLSVILVDQKDLTNYRRICRNLNRDKELDTFPMDPKVAQLAKERVQLATQLESLEHRTKRDQASEKWLERAAREAELGSDDEDEKIHDQDDDDSSSKNATKQIQSLQRRLTAMLSVPIKKREPITKYPSAYQDLDIAGSSSASKSGESQNGTTNRAIESVSRAKEEGKRLGKRLAKKKGAGVSKTMKGGKKQTAKPK